MTDPTVGPYTYKIGDAKQSNDISRFNLAYDPVPDVPPVVTWSYFLKYDNWANDPKAFMTFTETGTNPIVATLDFESTSNDDYF